MAGSTFAVLGAGRQGIAAAYDLAVHGNAARVIVADSNIQVAHAAAKKIDELAGRPVAEPVRVDATDDNALRKVLQPAEAVLSALPFALNPKAAAAAVAAHAHFADLGGNTQVSAQVLALDAAAKHARVTLVPDCGLAPGLSATLAAYLVQAFEEPTAIRLRCGGLPQQPKGPLDYQLVFSIEGLTNEYLGEAEVLRGGKVEHVQTLEELETLDFPHPLGRCEAFTTSGGTSTLPKTYAGKLSELDYKTVRYPGHCDKVKAIRDLGLLATTPIDVKGKAVVPRHVFHACAEKALTYEGPDVVVLRAEVSGRHEGKPARWRVDIMDFAESRTGFSAMQRMTGFPAAMVVEALANGEGHPGAVPLELALPPAPLVDALSTRGIVVRRTTEIE